MRIMTWVPSSVHNTPKLSNKLPSEPYEVTRGVHQSSGEVEGILFKRVFLTRLAKDLMDHVVSCSSFILLPAGGYILLTLY